jgi:predicted DNA-binding protein with PD1-like motif
MRSKLLDQSNGEKIFAVILQPGDEVTEASLRFAKAEHITAASLTAIGAFERATVGWFDIERKKYRPIPIDEQVELLSCIGDFRLRRKARCNFTHTSLLAVPMERRAAGICSKPTFARRSKQSFLSLRPICAVALTRQVDYH